MITKEKMTKIYNEHETYMKQSHFFADILLKILIILRQWWFYGKIIPNTFSQTKTIITFS